MSIDAHSSVVENNAVPLQKLRCTTGRSVERKGGGYRIRSTPVGIKARRRAQRCSRWNGGVIGQIGDRHRRPTLGEIAVPQLRDRLPIGKTKLQTPAVDRRRPRIGDRQVDPKAGIPLIGDGIANFAACAPGWGWRRAWGRRGSCCWCVGRRVCWCRCWGSATTQRKEVRFKSRPIIGRSASIVADERWSPATIVGRGPGPGHVAGAMLVEPTHERINKARSTVILAYLASQHGHLCNYRRD